MMRICQSASQLFGLLKKFTDELINLGAPLISYALIYHLCHTYEGPIYRPLSDG